nr:hypothetical protein [Microctonus hyperodae filamentous virus]
MLRSKKPEAQAFRRWVTSEVLPSIRRTGAYVSPQINQQQLSTLMSAVQELTQNNTRLTQQLTQVVENNTSLVHRILEHRPRLAVMPEEDNVKHTLKIFQFHETFAFVRVQKRNLQRAIEQYNKFPWQLIYERSNIPNGVNVLNVVKSYVFSAQWSLYVPPIASDYDLYPHSNI